jgi:hypothetical protein
VWTYYNELCYTDLPIPATYVNDGVPNADYILFPTVRPVDSSTVAYALACINKDYFLVTTYR